MIRGNDGSGGGFDIDLHVDTVPFRTNIRSSGGGGGGGGGGSRRCLLEDIDTDAGHR